MTDDAAAGPGPPAANPPALATEGLCKTFGTTRAVDHLGLTVPPGSFYGLVGPNGAGKTTALSMAVGLLRPDAGRVRILGTDVWSDPVAAKTRVGVLPDGLALPERLTGHELLTYMGALRRLDPGAVAGRSEELLEVLDLAGAGRTLVIDYSAGMRKKIGLAAALLHAPGLLVLDEPFEAVDPVSASTIRTILQRFVAGGGRAPSRPGTAARAGRAPGRAARAVGSAAAPAAHDDGLRGWSGDPGRVVGTVHGAAAGPGAVGCRRAPGAAAVAPRRPPAFDAAHRPDAGPGAARRLVLRRADRCRVRRAVDRGVRGDPARQRLRLRRRIDVDAAGGARIGTRRRAGAPAGVADAGRAGRRRGGGPEILAEVRTPAA